MHFGYVWFPDVQGTQEKALVTRLTSRFHDCCLSRARSVVLFPLVDQICEGTEHGAVDPSHAPSHQHEGGAQKKNMLEARRGL